MNRDKKTNVNISLDNSLGFLVNGLARLMRTDLETRLKAVDMTPTSWTVLMALTEREKLSQTDIAKRTFLDGATMTRVLDFLEARKLIERQRDVIDRRVQNVELTPTGRIMVEEISAIGMAVNDDTTSALSQSERQCLEDLLRRLVSSLQNHVDSGDENGK